MKSNFWSNVFSTVIGIFLTFAIMTVMSLISLIFIIATSSTTPAVEDNSVLVLNLKGVISEYGKEDVLGAVTGKQVEQLGLNNILSAIDKAKANDKIKGIYLETGLLQTDYATLQEIRNRLADFQKSGKWVIAYADQYMQGAYYLASVANKIYINPLGEIDWKGIGAQTEYYRDFLAKFGVKMDVVKVGTYKSYTETYTEDRMSEANREQVTVYITGIWENITNDVSKSRGISCDSLNSYADRFCAFETTGTFMSRKMIDGVKYADEIKNVIRKQLNIKDDEYIPQVTLKDMASLPEVNDRGGEIAVYYCEGGIVMNQAISAFASDGGIVASKVCRDLESLADDDNIKAVVLRVNSGGGDAYASEQLWRSVSILKKKKPVVVSMGGAAASGGYYMSCNASWIVAQPTTITGSIGIFGMFPDASELITSKLGIHFDEAKTNANSNFSPVGLTRPMNDEERSYMQKYIDRGYETFVKRVADGRKKSVDDIKAVAQGRVWTGQAALKIGLVDALGGLDVAISKAAALAKLTEYHTADYPAPVSWIQQLMEDSSRDNYLDSQMRMLLGTTYEPYRMLLDIKNQAPIQARMPLIITLR